MRLQPRASLKTVLARCARALRPGVAEVPPELDACESACRRTDCRCEEWQRCELRLRHLRSRLAHDREPDATS
jgi:hypothetical protein